LADPVEPVDIHHLSLINRTGGRPT
jgi:hypothetical protein